MFAQQHDNLKTAILNDMESRIDTELQPEVAEIHLHSTSNELDNIKSTIAVNNENVKTHLIEHDNAISNIRKNIAEHIESVPSNPSHTMETGAEMALSPSKIKMDVTSPLLP
jgi:hypothetical protein